MSDYTEKVYIGCLLCAQNAIVEAIKNCDDKIELQQIIKIRMHLDQLMIKDKYWK